MEIASPKMGKSTVAEHHDEDKERITNPSKQKLSDEYKKNRQKQIGEERLTVSNVSTGVITPGQVR